MGLAASSGHDNDDLIDKLIDANIVVTHRVEAALRLVDRRRFFPVEGRYIAYKDLAWKSDFGSPGRIHISAPCIYGNVLECLDLQEGNSFLNVGSGTGYLSTVAGYLLGSSGTNHGVEIHPNIVEYARSLVVETLQCPETQCYDWAIPEFSCGNGLYLSPSHYSKYDRVYCGAAVPPSHRRILWELLKINGILVMPYEDQLLRVRRQAANAFEVKIITSVSFSDFIPPTEEETSKELYSSAPSFRTIPTLQFLCASSIRKIIRAAVATNHKIHIRNFVGQQPHRVRDDHVVIEFRDGERPVEQNAHFENRHPPFREILAIVGADFTGGDENENNNEVERADPERRRLDRERFRLVWLRHHLHIANRAVRRRHLPEAEAQGDSGTEDDQNNDEVTNRNENSEHNGSSPATAIDPTGTPADTVEPRSDGTSTIGRSKKRSRVENEGESSLSVKRRNDDDDDGLEDKETMETDVISDECEAQNNSKQDLPDESRSGDESMIAAIIVQETLTELERDANQKNELNQSQYFAEVENSENSKIGERATKNNGESVSRQAKEMIEEFRDSRGKETENVVVASISKHKESNCSDNGVDESMNSGQSDNENGVSLDSSSSNFNHDARQKLHRSNGSIFLHQDSKQNGSNDIKFSNNLTSKTSGEVTPSEISKNDKLMKQNNGLQKNKTETSSAERLDSSTNGNIVNANNSSGSSEILSVSNGNLEEDNNQPVANEERENSNVNGDDYEDDNDSLLYVDDDDDDEDEDDDYDYEVDDDDYDDDDDDTDVDGNDDDDDDDESAILSNDDQGGDHGDYRVRSWDENELYLAVRQTCAVAGQASNRNRENGGESESSDNDNRSAMEDEPASRHRSGAREELRTEEEKKREQARLEERGRQLSDIRKFAAVFERRIMELPLNRALKDRATGKKKRHSVVQKTSPFGIG